MRNFVLTLCCALLLFNSSYKSHAGVICEEGLYPVTLNAITCCQETINDFMVFSFWDGDEMVLSGTMQFTGAPATYMHEYCIPAGCYTVQCDYGSMNAEHFQSIVFSSEYFTSINVIETWNNLPWNFEVCVGEQTNNDCPSQIWSNAGNDCGVMNFEIGSFVQGEEVVWYPGDESGAVEGGHFFSHHYEEPGTYNVCAFYTTPACPDGVELCTEIVVEACESTCPDHIWSGAGNDCQVMNFEIGSFVQGEEVVWYPGDESGAVEGGHFFSHHYEEPGTYNVCAFYTTPACPNGVELCTEIFVESCGDACPDYIVDDQIDCSIYVFHIEGAETGNVIWDFGDESGETSSVTADHSYSENGVYVVTALYNGPGCPNQTFLTFTVEVTCEDECHNVHFIVSSDVEEDGPTGGVMTIWNPQTNNILVFEEFTWTAQNVANDFTTCLPDGCYEVVVDGACCINYGNNYSMQASSNNADVHLSDFEPNDAISGSFVLSVNADCAESICPDHIWSGAGNDCGVMNFEIGSFVQGEEVFWYPGDESGAVEGGHFFSHHYEEPGIYNVCAFYTTPACPDGVELCTEIVVEACESTCPDHIWSGATNDCGVMHFEIGSFVQGEEVVWYPGDESGAVEGGHFFSHHYEEPGTYHVCAFYVTPACPDGVELCTDIVVEECGSTCSEVVILMESQVDDDGPEVVHWSIANLDNEMLFSGTSNFSINNPALDEVACLEDGCYILTFEGLQVADSDFDYEINLLGSSIITDVNEVNDNLVQVSFSINSNCEEEPVCEASFDIINSEIPGHFGFANTSNITENVQWVWQFGNGSTAQTFNSDVTYAENGTYEVCLTMYVGDCVSQHCEMVLVNDFEQTCTPFELTIESDILNGGTAEVAYTLWNSLLELTTAFDNVAFTPQITTYEFVGCIPDGCYQLTLYNETPIVFGQNVDVDIEIDGQPINGSFEFFVLSESAFMVQFGINNDCTVKIDESETTALSLYPNPANDIVHIQTNGKNLLHSVAVLDITGKMIMQSNPNTTSATLDVSDLSSGVYFIKTISDNKNEVTRIVVQH